MRLKQGTTGIYLYAPEEYISMAKEQNFIDFSKQESYELVHLFVESKQDYYERIPEALSLLSNAGVLWISYPKSNTKNRYDVNRDVLFEITPEQGIQVCSNVSLDDKWSALRFKKI
jgi:hypothetical protein